MTYYIEPGTRLTVRVRPTVLPPLEHFPPATLFLNQPSHVLGPAAITDARIMRHADVAEFFWGLGNNRDYLGYAGEVVRSLLSAPKMVRPTDPPARPAYRRSGPMAISGPAGGKEGALTQIDPRDRIPFAIETLAVILRPQTLSDLDQPRRYARAREDVAPLLLSFSPARVALSNAVEALGTQAWPGLRDALNGQRHGASWAAIAASYLGRRLYVHQDSLTALARQSPSASANCEEVLAAIILRKATSHFLQDFAHTFGVDEPSLAVLQTQLRNQIFSRVTQFFRSVGYWPARPHERDLFLPLLGEDEDIYDTCAEAGYLTLGTDLISALRMFAEQETDKPIRQLRIAYNRAVPAELVQLDIEDLTILAGACLALMQHPNPGQVKNLSTEEQRSHRFQARRWAITTFYRALSDWERTYGKLEPADFRNEMLTNALVRLDLWECRHDLDISELETLPPPRDLGRTRSA